MSETTPALEPLLAAAHAVAEKAYAPYSKYRVGAAVRTAAGNTFVGCNVENASFGLTICAERNAVAAAIAGEGPAMKIAAAAVFVDADQVFSPCGACRQVLAEFGEADTAVIYASSSGAAPRRTTLGELLPQEFSL